MSAVGENYSLKPAEMLAEALNATGRFTAKPVEQGCAVRVRTIATHDNAPEVPIATATVWLPDPSVNAGYVWTAPFDYELPADVGVDEVVATLSATLASPLPEEKA